MCPGCKAEVLREMDRIDSSWKRHNERLLLEVKGLHGVVASLENQRSGLLKAIEKLNSLEEVRADFLGDQETILLF